MRSLDADPVRDLKGIAGIIGSEIGNVDERLSRTLLLVVECR